MTRENLFDGNKIDEIQVNCPIYHENYIVEESHGLLICPACGEEHDPEHYTVFYHDGSKCSAKTAKR